ncbi:8-oxo-dGDP phosphatase NUDT18-like isoform X3 [Eriocheir sinensis]|uniref:8-oxo-dGDP phosphatase NUDT18-like isoform X3 n=1 Tax=Eriocheir sinensis TaxID=95602 RepID=UPI0021C9C36E|nr:8-oxo-dGDP phosphatase NUDT18-like isoform X3 [Eriocheir sinensis]
MDSIEGNIKLLLQGKEIEESQDFCDFTLQDQNEVTAKGVAVSTPEDFTPELRNNVCFIVAAVLLNNEGHVLMMQEAKSSCAGKWYLPAGRMEAGETIVEAAKREVLEETGLEADITTLLMVESAAGSWFRFVVTGNVLGGELKTPASADKESLQAKWVDNLAELSLRGNDIYPLIHRVKQYWERDVDEPWHPILLPVDKPHTKLLLRLVIAIRKRVNNRVCVLTSDKTATHLPVTEINPVRSLHSTLRKYMTEIFGSDLPPHRPQGILNVELKTSDPSGTHDGVCLSLLVPIRKALEEVPLIDKYSWVELPKQLGEDLLNRMGKNMIVPLNVIRVSTLIN